jgi:ABC-2 type transport system permease protein
MSIQVILLLIFGVLLYGITLPSDSAHWITFIWVMLLGLISSTLLGIAFSSVPKSGRGASAVVSPIVIILQFFSGVFFVFTQLPSWMQNFAAIFPLKWLTQGMRAVFLPDSFAAQEVAGSWELGKIALFLGMWSIAGFFLALKTFRWEK